MPRPVLTRKEPSGGGKLFHPAGAFVCTVTNAVEDESMSYMEITYEIAEGEHAGAWEYSNKFRRYYDSNNPEWDSQFEKFMRSLDWSNETFDMIEWQHTWNPEELIGLEFGAVFRERLYTDDKGNDRSQPRLFYTTSTSQVRKGGIKLPEPIDERVKLDDVPDVLVADGVYDDVPF